MRGPIGALTIALKGDDIAHSSGGLTIDSEETSVFLPQTHNDCSGINQPQCLPRRRKEQEGLDHGPRNGIICIRPPDAVITS